MLKAAVLLVPIAVALMAGAPANKSTLLRSPLWAQGPSREMLEQFYPAEARRKGIAGGAKIRCLVAADGHTSNCRVLNETPPGLGFGQAALKVAAQVTLAKTMEGRPTAGAVLEFPIRFTPRETAA